MRPVRVNQIDWYGRLWTTATFIYESELPCYASKRLVDGRNAVVSHWFGPLARCAAWDSRDGFELTP